MDINRASARSSTFGTCVTAAAEYGLTIGEARSIVDHQVTAINENWDDVAEMVELNAVDKSALFGRQILNPYSFSD